MAWRGTWRARAWSRRRAACLGGSARHGRRNQRLVARAADVTVKSSTPGSNGNARLAGECGTPGSRWLARRGGGVAAAHGAAWRARALSRRACHQETSLGGSRRAAGLGGSARHRRCTWRTCARSRWVARRCRRRTAYLACAGVESAGVPPRDQSWRLAACRQSWRLGSAQAAHLACVCLESMDGSAWAAHLVCAA
jgi:hypothetical protein